MHELAVIESIVEACSDRAGNARVLRVTLEIGVLACVTPDSLHFCYEIAVEGTPLEGSDLEILRIPACSRCLDCGSEIVMYKMFAHCACGSINIEPPRGGDGLRIKSMEIEPVSTRDSIAEVS